MCYTIVFTISSTGDCTEAVKIYKQIETVDTLHSRSGLGLAFNLSGYGQEGLQGLLLIVRWCAK